MRSTWPNTIQAKAKRTCPQKQLDPLIHGCGGVCADDYNTGFGAEHRPTRDNLYSRCQARAADPVQPAMSPDVAGRCSGREAGRGVNSMVNTANVLCERLARQ